MQKVMILGLLMILIQSNARALEVKDFIGDYKNVISCVEREDAYNVQGYFEFGLRISIIDGGVIVQRCEQNSDWCPQAMPFVNINEGDIYLPDVGYTESYYNFYIESSIEGRSLIRKEFTKSLFLRMKKNITISDKVTLNKDGTIEYSEFRGMTCLYSK